MCGARVCVYSYWSWIRSLEDPGAVNIFNLNLNQDVNQLFQEYEYTNSEKNNLLSGNDSEQF